MYLARIEAACTWTTAVYVLFLQKPSGYFWVVRLLCSFVQMLDVYKAKNPADVLILGDFNIDMLKPHSCWDSTLALFGLAQLITSPTRTTPTSTSLRDHIYTNNPSAVVTTDVSDLSISDHNPISCTRSIKLTKPKPKGHTQFVFRSFKHFNQNAFFADLICTPFDNAHQHTDPNEALAVWYLSLIHIWRCRR